MAICHCCELLKIIGKAFPKHRQAGVLKIKRLLALGDKILDNLNEEHMKKYFLDRDFKGRTVLKIISQNKFYPLLSSEKVNRLINELWVGSSTY